jgi:myo-inositol-1(or 4)-monophosphatase
LAGAHQTVIPIILDHTSLKEAFPELSAFQAVFLKKSSEQENTKLIQILGQPSEKSQQKKENIERLEFAVDLAVRAGNLSMRYYNSSYRSNQAMTSGKNASTLADRETQAEVIGALTGHHNYRHDGIIAEEEPYKGNPIKEKGYTWVIDPLDGTTNFDSRLPMFCTAIGSLKDGKPYLGVVYDMLTNEVYYAVEGQATRIWNISRGTDIAVSTDSGVRELEHCILATHISATTEKAKPLFENNLLLTIQQKVRTIRTLGCGQLALAYLAAGRIHFFFQIKSNLWDQLAGIVLIKNAGGTVTDLDSKVWHYKTQDFVASANRTIHSKFIEILKQGFLPYKESKNVIGKRRLKAPRKAKG